MALSKEQYAALQQALLSAYTRDTLTRMLRFELDTNLNNIVGGSNFSEIVFNLIDWAEQQGRTQELIQKAHETVPGNALLTAVYSGIKTAVATSSVEKRKIKVLFLAANPEATGRIALDEEYRTIQNRVRAAEYRDSIEILSEWAVRPLDLQEALLRYKPDIVHFSCHGTEQEEILLQNDAGQPYPVSKQALQSLFGILKDNVRVVVMNACYSEPQAEAIVQHIPCAVGMSKDIGVQAANTFSERFYSAIGYGRSVQEAFDLGCNALLLTGIPEETTPQLKTHPGISASEIVLTGINGTAG